MTTSTPRIETAADNAVATTPRRPGPPTGRSTTQSQGHCRPAGPPGAGPLQTRPVRGPGLQLLHPNCRLGALTRRRVAASSLKRDRALRSRNARGFTLSEVLIAATLSVFILAGILSVFLFIGRSSFAASSYSELEAEARRGLETFAEDVRMAHDVRWNNPQCLTLMIEGASGPMPVTYAYDNEPDSPTYRAFYRLAGEDDSTAPRHALIRNLAPDFSFKRYKLEQPGVIDNTAGNDLETKQIQLTLRAVRSGSTVTATTNSVVSARYVLRNKRVSE